MLLNLLLALEIIVSVMLVVVVLLQRSEGGALGMGGGPTGFMTARGAGDLRFYAVVQFFPMLAIPAMVLFFSSRYTGGKYLLILAGFYAAAKVLEFFDAPIFSVGRLLSGHTLKHLSSAAGTFWVLVMLQKRKLTQSMNLDSVGIPHAKTRGIGMTAPQKTP